VGIHVGEERDLKGAPGRAVRRVDNRCVDLGEGMHAVSQGLPMPLPCMLFSDHREDGQASEASLAKVWVLGAHHCACPGLHTAQRAPARACCTHGGPRVRGLRARVRTRYARQHTAKAPAQQPDSTLDTTVTWAAGFRVCRVLGLVFRSRSRF
jgi:hypothetical protein